MKSRLYAILTALSVLLCGCTADEAKLSAAYGTVHIALSGTYDKSQPVSITLSSESGEYSHTWPDVSHFPGFENYRAGVYNVSAVQGMAGAEGYDCPCYIGKKTFTVSENSVADVVVDMSLSQSIFAFSSESLSSSFKLTGLSIQTPGNSPVSVDLSRTEPLYLTPGDVAVFANLADADGTEVVLAVPSRLSAAAGDECYVNVSLGADNILCIECDRQSVGFAVTEKLFSDGLPVIDCEGFISGELIEITEGVPPAQPIVMRVSAPAGLGSVMVSVKADFNLPEDLSAEMDILQMRDTLSDYGLIVDTPDNSTAVMDFSSLLENIGVKVDSRIDLCVRAYDILNRVSEVSLLEADINRVNFELVESTPAVLGKNETVLSLLVNVPVVEISDFRVAIHSGSGECGAVPYIGSFDPVSRLVSLRFNVPEGIDEVPVDIYYMNDERLQTQIERTSPSFTISSDAFATFAILTVKAETEAEAEAVVRYITLDNNDERLRIGERKPSECRFTVAVLAPATDYRLPFRLIDAVSTASFTTERATQLPDGDFEDGAPLINYRRLPSGGMFSASEFPIYNMQNYTDIDVWWPKKHWASFNAKTFCREAENHNTWYMYPSSVLDLNRSASGSKSIRISSVGWSLSGKDIPPTMQQQGVYTPYNTNIPALDSVSAGRLFLGSYSFDPSTRTERINEGYPFISRPSSLNGYYRYIPDAGDSSDRGTLQVELVNNEGDTPVVVAAGYMLFSPSPDFKSFNLPLTYLCYNIRPTQLRVMFTSSAMAGIPGKGDTLVPVTPLSESATFTGSTLWIDNLSFSY